ncbi:response regulator [Flaviaesturariibacter amylovorans]|uniref:histidine kinase n=1 Tax=Flaviaesturariibacter amylovorans TaxID=1084520 RepID=A0ABP8HN01_9BACT
MKRLFERLPLPVKLLLVALVPLALLLYFAFEIFLEKDQRMEQLANYKASIRQTARLSAFVDALQAERRYSFGYALRHEWAAEMKDSRRSTDSALQQFVTADATGAEFTRYTFVDSLPAFRRLIDRDLVAAPDVMNYYTNTIFRLNSVNSVSAGNNLLLRPVTRELQGQKLLSEMITYMGILRSNMYMALQLRQSQAAVVEGLRGIFLIYRSYETEFDLKATDSARRAYARLQQGSELRATQDFLGAQFARGGLDTTMDANAWWELSAVAMDKVRALQRATLDAAQKGVDDLFDREQKARDQSLFFLVLSLVLVAFIVSTVIYQISAQLNALNAAAQQISLGKRGVHLEAKTNDVVGSLTRSMIALDAANVNLAEAADAIGSGRFDVPVHPRSSDDILGNALLRMRSDLQQYHLENEEKLWQHTGMEALNEALRGEKEPEQLAQDALAVLAEYTGTEVGLLYTREDNHLEYRASYASSDIAAVPRRVEFGETLIGQVAARKKTMQLANVPDSYLQIASGSGRSAPAQVLLLPLIHNDVVEGVLELAALQEFTPQVRYFLQGAQPVVAVALHGARNRQRLAELLQETQAQSEELQAQHSELENINAELEAQAEKLQASEEELRVQQEELMQANAELEERTRLLEERNILIGQRNREIQQKAEELALSTRYKSEFLANMSHELRTPLNSILLLSRLLVENHEKNLSSDQVEYAQVIQTSGQGLLALIDEILDLSKIEAGRMELEFAEVPVEVLVHDLKGMFVPVAHDKGLAFEVTLAPGLPPKVETDRMRLEQVLKNLLSNALKFTSEGTVQLLVAPGAGEQVRFSVRDTGIGIPADKQALVFEAFRQADGSTRRKYGGTGLGLSISRELTRLLGGELRVESEAGKGSTFFFELPVSRQAAPPAPAPAEAPLQSVAAAAVPLPLPDAEPALQEPATPRYHESDFEPAFPDDRNDLQAGDRTLLIIEDDKGFARALLDYTRSKGYKCLVAVRGDEGIALAQRYLPMGILLDIQLPVKDGWEVMEALKGDPRTRPIPVHMMSSLEAKQESRMKGAIDFISKPVAFEQMQEVFRKIEQVVTKEHRKVLIVEENPKHAQALAYFLETFNVSARITGTVEGSGEALQEEGVDCVILDIGMPDNHTFERLDGLKQQPGLEGLPIILFTGRSFSRSEEVRIKQVADSIVVKTAHSYQRILDEVSLFLHLVEQQAGEEPARRKRLGGLTEVLTGKKILVTDDDVRNIFSLSRALEQHGMQVFSATDGKEALQRLREQPDIDVVLMDIMMPEMDGYEAMRAIRRQPELRNLPVIAVTAKAMSGDREKCIEAGASDYISKPVDIDQLLSLLRVWLYE